MSRCCLLIPSFSLSYIVQDLLPKGSATQNAAFYIIKLKRITLRTCSQTNIIKKLLKQGSVTRCSILYKVDI